MFTLGYAFRPWTEAKAIADGPSILELRARDGPRVRRASEKIRFRHRVVRAEWSSADARWTVEVERGDAGETVTLTCGFLFMCSGYYRYDEGYTPRFEGSERFAGRIVHPQHWTDDIDYAGKRVVVIGSGATAVTLVPAMAESAAHVTMLQRSPSYVASLPAEDPIADVVRRVLPTKLAYSVVRWKNVLITMVFFQLCRRRPRADEAPCSARACERHLPPGYDVDTHFKPRYNPWDQRMCLVPGRRPLRGAEQRARLGGHGSHRDVHGEGPPAGVGRGARGGPGGHGHRPEHEAAGRHGARGRRPRGRAREDAQLQGPDAERSAEHGLLDRLHERVVDAQVRPDLRLRVPAAQPHGRARLRASACPSATRPLGRRRSRSSTSPPATCCALSTSSRSRGRSGPGGSTRTIRSTSAILRYGAIEDGALRFSAARPAVDGVDRVAA